MTKKNIMLITFGGILALSLWGFSSLPWIEGDFEFYPVNENSRPFIASSYYPGDIYLTKQNQKLHIKEMSYVWEGKGKGNAGIFLKDETWDSLFIGHREHACIVYDSLAMECEYRLFRMSYLISKNVNICKFFKGKKVGDEFKYTVTIVYSLDDEPESTQTIEYNVKMVMGKYKASLYRTRAMIYLLIYR